MRSRQRLPRPVSQLGLASAGCHSNCVRAGLQQPFPPRLSEEHSVHRWDLSICPQIPVFKKIVNLSNTFESKNLILWQQTSAQTSSSCSLLRICQMTTYLDALQPLGTANHHLYTFFVSVTVWLFSPFPCLFQLLPKGGSLLWFRFSIQYGLFFWESNNKLISVTAESPVKFKLEHIVQQDRGRAANLCF